MTGNLAHQSHWFTRKESCHILIIDDDEADRALYKKYLKAYNAAYSYSFHEASSGAEGLELFRTLQPDCVLLDYLLPDISGLDVLSEMARCSAILPVVMLTGHGNSDIAAATIKSGAQNYMPKNVITAESLCQAINYTLDRVHLLAQAANQNKALENAKEEVQQAYQSKHAFLQAMSRDIQEPLNTIIEMADFIGHTQLSVRQKAYLDSIHESGESVLRMLQNIVDFSRFEMDGFDFDVRRCDVQNVVAEALDSVSRRAMKRHVDLVVDWPADCVVPAVYADTAKMRLVLIHLLEYAVQRSYEGCVRVGVDVAAHDEQSVQLRFEVEDNGAGDDAGRGDHALQQFTRLESPFGAAFMGGGLGLSICKRLVGMMGGEIGAKQIDNGGSLLWFSLKMSSVPQSQGLSRDVYLNSLQGRRVLLVDETPVSLDLLTRYLAPTHAHITVAIGVSMAKDALAKAKRNGAPFDVVLHNLSGASAGGDALSCAIAEDAERFGRPHCIVAVHAAQIKALKQAGCAPDTALLFKPLFPDTLVRGILDVVEGRDSVTMASVSHLYDFALPEVKAHVLLLVDERCHMGLRMVCGMLDELGCSYDMVTQPGEAIERLKTHKVPYHAMLIDWQVPLDEGGEIIASIRQHPFGEDIRIIAMVAHADEADKETCLQAGVNDYLIKPVRVSDIIRALQG